MEKRASTDAIVASPSFRRPGLRYVPALRKIRALETVAAFDLQRLWGADFRPKLTAEDLPLLACR